MTKLNPEQTKKLVLVGLMFACALYAYFAIFLADLNKAGKAAEKKSADLEPQLRAARAALARARQIEAELPAAAAALDSLKTLIPDEDPVAWVPRRIVDYFKRHGVTANPPRFSRAFDQIPTAKIYRAEYSVEIPKTDIIGLGIALAGLENEDPLVEVLGVRVEADAAGPEFQRAILTLAVLVKEN
jgi:hypothetical protein